MKNSRERKVIGAVLGCALLALGADRLFLSGGTPASTPEQAESHAPSPITDARVTSTASSDPSNGVTLDIHLARLADLHALDIDAVPDAFVPGDVWGTDEIVLSRPVAVRRTSESFQQAHTLRGVLMSPAGPTAIVDESALRVGEELDGARLRIVQSRSVTFDLDGTLVTLALDSTSDR